ncbi:MAG: PAQR family membrane homeostasis protein TrhA [Christensenellales bacterium]|jgi:hemolysin III
MDSNKMMQTLDDIGPRKLYTRGEEIFNAVSHGVGTLLSIAALVVGVVFAALYGDAWRVVSAAIYGATLIILYCMSTLYHAITNPTAKKVFRVFDHCSIFFLIAGTYTPYTLVTLRGPWGWSLFAVVWAAAILGTVLNAISIERFKKFSIVCYVAMGWVVILAVNPLLQALPMPGFWLLIGGGVVYTLGIIFYKLKNLRYAHSIWHLFVLGGSALHFFSILLYVLPQP